MAGINFLSDNFVDLSSITITTGAANAQFPLSNIQNISTAKKFRSTGNTVVIEFDLQQTRDLDTIAIVGDATTGLGISAISFKTSVTTDFSLSTPIPITLSSEHNVGFEFITEVSHRFVEATMTGTGSFAEISNIFVGKRINITQNNFSISSFRYGYDDKSNVRPNRYGQKFIDELPLRKVLGGTIEFATKDEQETLDDMFLKHGIHEPLWVIIDDTSAGMNEGNFKLTMYSFLSQVPIWTASGGQNYNASLDLDQVI